MSERKPKYTFLSFKKIRRTLFKSPLQFIAIILITLLATGLFNGFYASAEQFKNQVATADVLSNTANITTTVSVDDDNPDVKKELEGIKNVIGDKGKVETRYCFETKMNGSSCYICLYDDYPTISKEHYFKDEKKVDKENFFVIDYRFPNSTTVYGEGWKDKQGNLLPINVSFPITKLVDDFKIDDRTIEPFLKDGKENPFKTNFLNLTMTPNTYMKSYDNIVAGDTFTSYNFMSRKLFNSKLKEFFKDTFKDPIEVLGGSEEIKELIKDPVGKITEKYYRNNQYLTRLNNDGDTNKTMNDISDHFKKKGTTNNLLANIDKANSEATKIVTTDINQTVALSYLFPSIFLFVSLLVTLTTFAQIILKERNEIGTLKAMGVKPVRIIAYYIAIGLIITILGCFLGVMLGPTFIPGLLKIKFYALYIIPYRVFIFPTLPVIFSTLGIILLTSLVIFIITKRECSLPPSFSLRPVLPKSVKSGSKAKEMKVTLYYFLLSSLKEANKKEIISNIKNSKVTVNNEIVNKRWKKINPLTVDVFYKGEKIVYKKSNKLIPLKLALRNIRCSIPKSAMVVIGVAGCVAILGGAFGINDTLQYGLSNEVRRFLSSDINLTFNNPTDATKDELDRLKDKTHEIEKYELYSAVPCTMYKMFATDTVYTSTIYTIPPKSSFVHLDNLKINGRKVVVTKKVAEKLDLKIGTSITFNALGYTEHVEIAGILDSFYIQGIFADASFFTKFYAAATGVYIETNKELIKNNREFAERLLKIPGVVNYYEYERNYEALSNSFKGISYITLILKASAIALAVVVLYNFVILNYKQRSRDIATMKVLGFNNRELGMSMLFEVLILVGIGTLIGVALSLPTTMLLLSINKNDMIKFSPTVFPQTYAYAALITIGTTILVNIAIMIRNKRIKMVESLKSVE